MQENLPLFFHDFLLPSFTNRQNFVISFLKIISKMSETEHAYSISVKYDVADGLVCIFIKYMRFDKLHSCLWSNLASDWLITFLLKQEISYKSFSIFIGKDARLSSFVRHITKTIFLVSDEET